MERAGTYEETEALDLRYYWSLALRHLPILVLVPVLLGAAAYFNADRETRMYTAKSMVLLRPNDPNERLGSSTQGQTNLSNIGEYVQAQAKLMAAADVRDAAADKLELDTTTVEEALTVTALEDSNALEVSATTDDPAQSKKIADAVAVAYIANRRDYARAGLERAIADINSKIADVEKVLQTSRGLNSQTEAELSAARTQYEALTTKAAELDIDLNLKNGEAELIAPAEEPTVPVSPRVNRSAALGGMLGVLLAAGFVLLKDRFDNRLRSREEAEAVAGLPALGELPFDKLTGKQYTGIGVVRDPDGVLAESVRSLRVSLRFLSLENPIHSLLITSPTPGDGKSTTSLNLAGSYAMAGMRTLLVSGDLRRPQAEKRVGSDAKGPGFVELLTELAMRREQEAGGGNSGPVGRPRPTGTGIGNGNGGTRTLAERATAETVSSAPLFIAEWCHADEDNLWVLPAGQSVANPVEILGSAATRDFFALAREQFDIVIVDSPPAIAVADPAVLAPHVDGVLIVCSVLKTSRNALQRASQLLGASHGRLLGLVVNRVPMKQSYSGYYSGPYK